MLLDGLPVELLLLVTSNLTTPEYSAVRLVCRALRNATYDSWAEEFFSTRQFSLQMFSLDVLLSIAKHADLSQRLKRLIIGTDMVESNQTDYLGKERTTKLIEYLETQDYMRAIGLDRQMLSDAINLLPNLTNIEVRNFWSDFQGGRTRDQQPWKSYGWSIFEKDMGTSLSLSTRTVLGPSEVFRKVLAAAVACQRLQRIVVHLRPPMRVEYPGQSSWAGLSEEAFKFPQALQAQYKAVLQHLETLMVVIAQPSPGRFESQLDTDHALTNFVSLTPRLNYLRVNLDKKYPVLRWISKMVGPMAPKLQDLRVLELGNMDLPKDELVELKAFESLRELSLFRIDLKEESWEVLVPQLVDLMPKLRTLSLGSVRQSVSASNNTAWMARVAFKTNDNATVTDMDDSSLGRSITFTDKRDHDLTMAVNKAIGLIVVDDEAFRRARGVTFDLIIPDHHSDSSEEADMSDDEFLEEEDDEDEDGDEDENGL